MRRSLRVLAAAAALAGCTADPGAPAGAGPSAQPFPVPIAGTATLVCEHSIDGAPPPPGFQVILGVVALPTSEAGPALQAGPGGNGADFPTLFAKTGLIVRAGAQVELETPEQPGNRTAVGWGSWTQEAPTRRFVVPGCPDDRGTGWLAYAGGYYADRPLCLPLSVRSGGREQQVRIGVGAACPGQQPPPTP
jgi:hypothetical protein